MINRKLSLPVPKQHTIARQVAEALTFLHERNVIHGRLNSKNVLLDREFSAKLSLFAIFHHAQLSPLDMEAAMFVAPEVRRGERPTDKADVYSFGVILVELDSEETPLANSKRTSSLMHQTTAEGVSPTTRRTGFRFSTTCSSMMKEIVMACLERDPELRPTMAEISSSLKTGEMTL
ncbi:TPA: hypothetical protein N0F65_003877 [Lagenidium giganteum]|uniref:Protein kinase domain-containing protein n=1 Tax=Lagenidium giganteum TaxID=4803 RepID=A0AAV2Z8T8_9STRA|nr:TPA: hypothetical protein N0F65_003877 [Lagenidium giganteum]